MLRLIRFAWKRLNDLSTLQWLWGFLPLAITGSAGGVMAYLSHVSPWLVALGAFFASMIGGVLFYGSKLWILAREDEARRSHDPAAAFETEYQARLRERRMHDRLRRETRPTLLEMLIDEWARQQIENERAKEKRDD